MIMRYLDPKMKVRPRGKSFCQFGIWACRVLYTREFEALPICPESENSVDRTYFTLSAA